MSITYTHPLASRKGDLLAPVPETPKHLTAPQVRVILVSTWGGACGIADHSRMLKESVEAADPTIRIVPAIWALDPIALIQALTIPTDQSIFRKDGAKLIVHLNHHDALHSRWQAEHIETLREQGINVIVTYHDTYSVMPSDAKIRKLQAVASSLIVHEPVADLPAIYWRQGVPPAAQAPANFAHETYGAWTWYPPGEHTRPGEQRRAQFPLWKAYPQQPVLGTVGFNFPWKNYDHLAQITADCGWALLILSTNATEGDAIRWKRLNPATHVVTGFLDGPTITNWLAGCDATAFYYTCANSGTSGAIRQGIAARKPVIALQTCRQFRDLTGETAIRWVVSDDDLRRTLSGAGDVITTLDRVDLPTAALAHQDSWEALGRQHAQLYRTLTGLATESVTP